MLTSCAEKSNYEDVSIWIDDYRFEILVEDYWVVYNDVVGEDASSEYDDTCLLAIIDDYQPYYWLVGDAFLKGYYSIHDNDNHASARMGWAPHTASNKHKVEKLAKPTIDVMDILWETTWIGEMADPSSKFSLGLFKMFSNLWIWFFGYYPIF